MITPDLYSYYGKEKSNFCSECGKTLVLSRIFDKYNTETGEKEYHYKKSCPTFLGNLFGHTTVEFDKNGIEIIHYNY